MSDIVEINQVSPEDAVANWLGCYRRLLHIESGMAADYRRRLRREYQKAKAILSAVLAGSKKRMHIDRTGVYYIAVDNHDGSCYPAWRPHEVTKTAVA